MNKFIKNKKRNLAVFGPSTSSGSSTAKLKKHKVAVFDIDGTIFRNSLTIELHWQLIKDKVFPKSDLKKIDSYYWAWVNRKGSYEDYLERVVESYKKSIKGKSVSAINKAAKIVVRAQKNIVYRYTRDLLNKVRPDYVLIAISGSPIEIVKEFNKYWKFDFILGTEMETKNKIYTGKIKYAPFQDKKTALKIALNHFPNKFKNSIAVGDTESDIPLFENVKQPICFNPTKKLYELAKTRGWQVVVERKNVIYTI